MAVYLIINNAMVMDILSNVDVVVLCTLLLKIIIPL